MKHAKTNRVLQRKCTGHSIHPLPTSKYSTHGHHPMVNTKIRLIIIFAAKGGSIQSAKTRLGADCGSDHEFLIAKFRLKLKKIGKNT